MNPEQEYYRDSEGTKRPFTAVDPKVERRGKKIILPEGMSFNEAAIWIERKKEEDEMVVSIDEVIEGYPLDAAYAFARALSDIYGWTGMVPTPGFWGTQNPPDMFGLQTGPNNSDTVQVPWGRFKVPNVDGYLQSHIVPRNGWPYFCIGGEVKNKDKEECAKIARRARQILAESSIYRNRAIRIKFPDDPRNFNIRDCPSFMDTSDINPDNLIFSDDLKALVDANIFAPVEHTQKCRELNIPLKRGILLEGPYGTGKTLTANVAAKKCIDNGFTFIYLEDTTQLDKALRFAKLYQPAMIFAEDIDRVMEDDDDNERNEKIQTILNTIDGVDTKNTEVVVVLTTNFIEKINQAMLRPGRLDAVISVRPPDPAAVGRLIRLFGGDLIHPDDPLTEVGKILNGQIPAVIREVVDRSKLAALSLEGNCDKLADKHLTITAKGMLGHLKLLEAKEPDHRSDNEKAAAVVVGGMMEIAKLQNGDAKRLPDRASA
jgi:transitional endoplasmic reticulum ATPase